KQRTRWSQGFLQTLKKGDWLRLATWGQRLLALYTLSFPAAQAVLGMYVIASAAMMFWLKTPVPVAIVLTLPLYMLVAHFLMALVGLYEFTSAHGLKPSWRTPVVMALAF